MPKNESVEFFLRFLRERFSVFRIALKDFLQALSLDDRTQKIERAKRLLQAIDDLKRAISESDHPAWINPLETKLHWYIKAVAGHPDAGLQVLQTLLDIHGKIEAQTWDFADASSKILAIDFAAIYQEYYQESRVPQLFDELVAQIEAIVNGGEIDSLQAINALERLILTIRKNARGDLFSTRGAWEFTQAFFKNYAIELLENTPGLRHALKALRKTMSELDLEFAQVHDRIRKRLADSAQTDLPMLEYRPQGLPAPKNGERDTSQDSPPRAKNESS
jgi:hypothetical protein